MADRVGAPHSLLHSLISWHSLRLWFFPGTQDDASCAVILCEIRVEFHHPPHLCHTNATDQGRIENSTPHLPGNWKIPIVVAISFKQPHPYRILQLIG
jgi:hypothetical protein